MDSDIKPRINAARSLAAEIARIGALDRRRSGARTSLESTAAYQGFDNQFQSERGGAVPVSPPNNLSGALLKVVVTNASAKADLANRLHELKVILLDLCDRQLNDLNDAAPAGQQQDIEDVDKLLAEMHSLRQGMETIVAIQGVLEQSDS